MTKTRTLRRHLLGLLLCLAASLVAAQSAAAYGTGDGTYYVATNGSDSNPGTQASPFATIDKARQAVRALISRGMSSDVIVMIRGGKYYQSSAVTFDENDSGRSGHKVIYTNYPGERPIIVGGRKITGWTQDSGHIYKVHLPDVQARTWDFNRLFENGVGATKARYPNSGYLKADSGGSASTLVYKTGADGLPSWTRADATAGGQVFVFARWDWFSNTRPISDFDSSTRTVTLASQVLDGATIDANSRYYVQGVKAALDAPGEWYLDRVAGDLYYYPRNTPIADQQIVAPTTQDVFIVKGSSSSSPAQNIQFEGLSFLGSEFTDSFDEIGTGGTWNRPADANRHGIIYMENASYDTVVDCTIDGAGFNGVMLGYYAAHNTVSGNEISDFGYHGVMLAGSDVGALSSGSQIYDNNYNSVTDNYIHDGGKTVGQGAGVFLYQSGDNTISHNVITRMPRYGIGMKGVAYVDMPSSYGGVAVTWANHWGFVTSRNNTISYNDVSDVLQDSEDAGLVSLIGTGTNNIIDSNTLHDVQRDFGMSHGIYLDDGSDYATARRNTVWGLHSVSNSGIYAKGVHNLLDNNVLIGNTSGNLGLRSLFLGGQRNDQASYSHNIVYQQGYPLYNDNWSDYRIAASDHNLFYNTSGSYLVGGVPGVSTLADWQRVSPYAISTTYGTVTVQDTPSSSDKSLRLVDSNGTGGNGVSVTRPFYGVSGTVSYQFDVNASQTTGGLLADFLDSSGRSALSVGLSGNGTFRLWKPDGTSTDLGYYTAGSWDTVRVDADVSTHTYDVYVDGRPVASAASFLDRSITSIDRVQLATGFGTGTYYVDDLTVSVPGETYFDDMFDAYASGVAPTYDQASLTSDPLFTDAANDDYSLQSGSPALRLGFQAISYSSIGLDSSAHLPSGLTASDQSDGVHLSWNAVSGASSYVVRRTTTSGESYSSIATPTGTTVTDTGALKGKRYYYTVSAVIGGVEHPASEEVGVDTQYVGSLLNSTFDGETTGAAPSGWSLSTTYGTVSVQEVPSSTQKSMRLVDTDGTGGNGVSATKTFTAQTGTVTFQTVARADQTSGGAFFELQDSSGTAAVSLGFSGVQTLRYFTPTGSGDILNYNARQWYTIKVVADVAAQRYDVYVDGVPRVSGQAFYNTVSSIDRLAVTTGFGTGTYYADYATVTKPMLLDDEFDSETTGASPAGYSLSTTYGTASVQEVPSSTQKSMRLVDTDGTGGNGVSATKTFAEQTGSLTCEISARADQTSGGFTLELEDSSGTEAIAVGFSGTGMLRYFTPSGYTDVGRYTASTYHTFRVVVADVTRHSYDLTIDGTTVRGLSFYNTVGSIDRIALVTGFGTGTYYADYVQCDT